MREARNGLSNKTSKSKFSYVDPVDDKKERLKEVPMANVHAMKFHEMKVEREDPTAYQAKSPSKLSNTGKNL